MTTFLLHHPFLAWLAFVSLAAWVCVFSFAVVWILTVGCLGSAPWDTKRKNP